jgi:apolipoprotein N-acyltransferase
LVAAASGALLSFTFPNARLWPLVFVALVPLLVILAQGTGGPAETGPTSRGVRWSPWIAGIVFNVLMFWWIVRLPVHAMTHPWIIWPALAALGLYLGLYFALFGWAVRFLKRRLGVSILFVAPFVWTLTEWAKSSGPLGCPWGNLGYALAREPAWIQGASLAGAPGLTFWIVSVNALVAGIVVARRWPTRIACAVLALGALILPVRWGYDRLKTAPTAPLTRVALVQPNTPSDVKWNPEAQDSVVGALFDGARQAAAAAPRPDLIIWPETSLPFYVRLEPAKLLRFLGLVKEIGIPILAGYPDARLSTGGTALTYNAAGLVRPNGTFAAQYEKMHLVPFGERIPFQEVMPFLGKIDLGQAEWTPGTDPVVFTGGGGTFGVMICFESIFPDHARTLALEGAQYLVNITNDEWFGKTAGPVQHADMAILRSVELGRATARCANTGISMFVDPYGRVSGATPLFERAIAQGIVPAPLSHTLWLEWGDWITMVSIAVTAVLLAVGWFRPIQRLDAPHTAREWR